VLSNRDLRTLVGRFVMKALGFCAAFRSGSINPLSAISRSSGKVLFGSNIF
jgi:hypothetical protein